MHKTFEIVFHKEELQSSLIAMLCNGNRNNTEEGGIIIVYNKKQISLFYKLFYEIAILECIIKRDLHKP